MWRAINWKRDLSTDDQNETLTPSDQEFKEHFEAVLNPADTPDHVMDFENVTGHDEVNNAIHVTIPVLDEAIMPAEVLDEAKKMKPDKASGPDGLPRGGCIRVVTHSMALNNYHCV